MELWLETTIVIVAAVLGIILGRLFSHLQKPYWLCGYFLSVLLVAMLVLTRYSNVVSFLPPLFWLATGWVRFVILSLAITMGLTTPLSRLPHRFEKLIICILMVVLIASFSVSHFLAAALFKDDLANLATRVNSDGICLQSRSYTCGPAAAVTALRKLGFAAQEGEIAMLSNTSPITGTLPRRLYIALQNRYRRQGLKCQYRYFDSVGQLKGSGITLAVVKDAFLLDHCVAVLEVSDQMVVIADPVAGKQYMSHEQFEKIWRFCGIVLERDSAWGHRQPATGNI